MVVASEEMPMRVQEARVGRERKRGKGRWGEGSRHRQPASDGDDGPRGPESAQEEGL